MDIVGVTSALDCFTTGDLGSCLETGLNVLMSFVGGLAGKIVAKYAFRFKAAYRLGKQLKNLANELIGGPCSPSCASRTCRTLSLTGSPNRRRIWSVTRSSC